MVPVENSVENYEEAVISLSTVKRILGYNLMRQDSDWRYIDIPDTEAVFHRITREEIELSGKQVTERLGLEPYLATDWRSVYRGPE